MMYYTKEGSGPTIVLLHGFPDDGKIWRGLAPMLSDRFQVIVPDFPGSGKSPYKAGVSLTDIASGVEEIIVAEGLDRVVLAGHSMGGYTAMAFAALYPHRLAGISMVHSTAAADDEEKKETRRKVIELIRKGGKEAFVKQMTNNLFAKEFLNVSPDVVTQKVNAGMQMTDEAMTGFYEAMIGRSDYVAMLDGLPFPVQWIAGKEDSIVDFRKILQLCHRSSVNFVSLYEQCGHMSMLESPEYLVRDLRSFSSYCFSRKFSSV